MNNPGGSMAEYIVQRKAEGKYLRIKIGCIALFAVIIFGFLSLVMILGSAGLGTFLAVIVITFLPIIILVLRYLIWNRYVNVEYKYEIISAKVVFYEVYGKQRESKVYERLISEYDLIAPVSEEFRDKYEGADIVRDFRGSQKTPDAYFMLATEPDGKKSVVFFEAAAKTLKALKYYNSKNLVDTKPTSR